MPIEEQTYKDVMTVHPGGVTVVTSVDADGEAVGLTVSAITTVSLHPPRLLIVIDKRSHTLPVLRESGGFTVSFLAEGEERIAGHFASPLVDKFSDLSPDSYIELPTGPAITGHSMAYLECYITQELHSGDHWIFVGTVESGKRLEKDKPLIYWHRGYRALDL